MLNQLFPNRATLIKVDSILRLQKYGVFIIDLRLPCSFVPPVMCPIEPPFRVANDVVSYVEHDDDLPF